MKTGMWILLAIVLPVSTIFVAMQMSPNRQAPAESALHYEEISTAPGAGRLYVAHDDKRNVTCYILDYRSVSCIPDAKMKSRE